MSANLTPDARAVDAVLARIRRDPRLAYLIGPGSESYDRLTEARALRDGVDPATYRRTLEFSLEFQRLPAIGDGRHG